MKLFRTVQKNLIPMGYIRNHGDCSYYLLRRPHLVLIGISIFTGGAISMFIFATFLAISPTEFMDSFYMLAVALTMLVSYSDTISNMTKLFDLIDNGEQICDKSKFRFSFFEF